jgi:ribosomal protein S18 acetylase RimI-like enzyme
VNGSDCATTTPARKRGSEDDVPDAFTIRPAQPADIPDLIRMKIALAASDDALDAVRATPADWMQDLFGDAPRFVAFVAEHDSAAVGMAICSERYVTGWPGPTIFLQDLFVDQTHRLHGVGAALMARVAAYAGERGSPIIEINVRADNPACHFYRKHGFEHVSNCVVFVAGVQMPRGRYGKSGSDEM